MSGPPPPSSPPLFCMLLRRCKNNQGTTIKIPPSHTHSAGYNNYQDTTLAKVQQLSRYHTHQGTTTIKISHSPRYNKYQDTTLANVQPLSRYEYHNKTIAVRIDKWDKTRNKSMRIEFLVWCGCRQLEAGQELGRAVRNFTWWWKYSPIIWCNWR